MFAPLSLPTGTSPQPSSPSRTAGRAYAEKAAKTILSRYPSTERAQPEYLAELTNTLAEQPPRIIDRVADRHLGITAKSPIFLPPVGRIVEMINQLREQEARYAHYSEVRERMPGRKIPTGVRTPFRPYPDLWAAFVGESDIIAALDNAGNFDWLTEASKRLAVRGIDAARKFIREK